MKENLIYLYDGTFDGLCCCVWRAFAEKENPVDIWCFDEEQPTLYTLQQIDTDPALALRVQDGVRGRLGPLAEQWMWDGYYSAMPHREHAVLEFLKLGFAKGPAVTTMVGHPQVSPIFAASRALHGEAHLLKGFIRFAEYGSVLATSIRPKNFVLPYLERHFSARFPRESYMIYDETHRCALVASGGQSRLVQVEELQLPEISADEARLRCMWQRFYETVAIQARENPKCRMTHMPKRYWDCVTELQSQKHPLPPSVRQAIAAGELTLPGNETADALPDYLTPTQASLANTRLAPTNAAVTLPVTI